ncbi:MAG: hypothetical protein FWD58_07435 [Firmicutes bacterium]|nr:hypothetical protein [Bacillota bacterium]
MKKKSLSVLAILIVALAACFALFACAGGGNGGGKASLLSVSVLGAKNVSLPASGAVTLQLTAEAKGSNLPAKFDVAWSVEKGIAATTDATVSESGLFSTSVAGIYTVKASVTVGQTSKTGQAQIAVSPYDPGNTDIPDPTDEPTLTALSIQGVEGGAASIRLSKDGAASRQFTAVPQGNFLPANPAITWTVAGGAATVANGLFSTQAVGTYTVKASCTVGSVTKEAQVTVTVGEYVNVPDDLTELIALVEEAIKTDVSVKNSAKTAYALREAKKTGAGDTQKEALSAAYLQASEGYPDNPNYRMVTAKAPARWANLGDMNSINFVIAYTVVFDVKTDKIADIYYSFPDNLIVGNVATNNTGVTTRNGNDDYWLFWTTERSRNDQPGGTNNYLDYMNLFFDKDAQVVSQYTNPGGGDRTGRIYAQMPAGLTMYSSATQTGRNMAASITQCCKDYLAASPKAAAAVLPANSAYGATAPYTTLSTVLIVVSAVLIVGVVVFLIIRRR